MRAEIRKEELERLKRVEMEKLREELRKGTLEQKKKSKSKNASRSHK